MRKIKFRAWCLKHKVMMESDRIGSISYGYGIGLYVNADTTCAGKEILMQYTGLKDINYKDVYEKDIVLVDEKDIAIVEFGLGYCGLIYVDDLKNPIIDKPITPISYTWQSMQKRISIIGNIYENPELFKEEEAYEL